MSTAEATRKGDRETNALEIKYPIPTNKRPTNFVNISNVLELLKVHLVDTGELFHPKNAQDDLGLGRTVWVGGMSTTPERGTELPTFRVPTRVRLLAEPEETCEHIRSQRIVITWPRDSVSHTKGPWKQDPPRV